MAKVGAEALLRWAGWSVAAIALVSTLNGLLAQVAIQAELNRAMQGVRVNIADATVLTRDTAEALAPLAATATKMEAMNEGIRATHADLVAMNQAMGRIKVQQGAILTQVGSLNSRTRDVITALGAVDKQNKALLSATAALSKQTQAQAGSVERLSGLTSEAVNHLNLLNRKFAFLKRL